MVNGKRTGSYYVFQQANEAVKRLSPLPSQLQTTQIERVAGAHLDPSTNATLQNAPPVLYRTWPTPRPVAASWMLGLGAD